MAGVRTGDQCDLRPIYYPLSRSAFPNPPPSGKNVGGRIARLRRRTRPILLGCHSRPSQADSDVFSAVPVGNESTWCGEDVTAGCAADRKNLRGGVRGIGKNVGLA